LFGAGHFLTEAYLDNLILEPGRIRSVRRLRVDWHRHCFGVAVLLPSLSGRQDEHEIGGAAEFPNEAAIESDLQ
jgi:hypothetical protein